MQYVNLLNRRVVGCLFGVSAFGVAVCGPATAAETIKIGSVLSITGPASFLGDPEDKTLKLYVDKINAAGVLTLRTLQDSNKLLASLLEQQTIVAKQQRDQTTNAINVDIGRDASLASNMSQVTATITNSLQNFRMP